MKPIKIDRDVLYKEVWETPIQRLSEEKYGITDRGLSKICAKLNVPTPPRGYWARVQHGQKLSRKPLPKLKKGQQSTYQLHGHYQFKSKEMEGISPDAIELIQTMKKTENPIVLPYLPSRDSHALIKNTGKDLAKLDIDSYGRISVEKSSLAIHVSPENADRAIRIMEALLEVFDELGLLVSVRFKYDHATIVKIFDEDIPFELRETSNKVKRPEEKCGWQTIDGKRRYLHQDYYKPSGKLTLRIITYGGDGFRLSWSDGKAKLLDDKLNEFIIGLIKYADHEHRERLERERRDKEEAEQRRIWQERERRRKIELDRLNELENQALQWNKSEQLRSYINHVEKVAAEKELSADEQNRVKKWSAWAYQHAERLDPTKQELPVYLAYDRPIGGDDNE